MINLKILIFALSSFLLTYIFLLKIIPILKLKILDIPNERSLHKKPIPRGGGIAFSLSSALLLAINGNFEPIFSLPLALVGLADDLKDISSKYRYLFQVITVLLLFINSQFIYQILNYGYLISIPLLLISLIFFTGIINFVNFMDGMDGLVASCMIVVFFVYSSLINPNYILITTSLVGFLIWNWPPAKVFMGDCGSTFLGSVFIGSLLHSKEIIPAIAVFNVSCPLILDAFFCVVRRYVAGQNIFESHKKHLYQRLFDGGMSQRKVVFLYFIYSSLIYFSYLFLGISGEFLVIFLMIIHGLYLDRNLAKPFS